MKIIFIIFLTILLFLIFSLSYFYREPRNLNHVECPSCRRRQLLNQIEDHIILSPAYGKIYKIIEDNSENIHIVIILNVFDIHTQYYPVNGTVTEQIYDANGNFALVYELYKSSLNEKVITTIEPKSSLITSPIIVQQIAGMFVRRIETSLTDVPEKIEAGQKLGRIKFGSRVDLILPKKNFILNLSEGDKVYGPTTIVGFYK